MFTMLAAFAGVLLGIVGSAGFVGNYLQSQFNAQTNALHRQLVSMSPTADETAAGVCGGANFTTGLGGGGAAPAAVTASAPVGVSTPGEVGMGGDHGGTPSTPSSHNTFVKQLVNGSISNTGPGSKNEIEVTNSFKSTTVNKNDVTVTNDNDQDAHSGSATEKFNTTAGSTQSGDATNTNTTNTNVSIQN